MGRPDAPSLTSILWRQWYTERKLQARRLFFRATDPTQVAAAYAAMSDDEFDAVDGRQDWDNWRTIPLAMSGRVPNRPLLVLDLGCGSGLSTQALAYYCPAGSEVVGYDVVSKLLSSAVGRSYVGRDGSRPTVSFVNQSLHEPFRRTDGQKLPANSVDLVNSSGVLGHHFRAADMPPLAKELSRVLVPGGQAQLDAGPTLSVAELTQQMSRFGFERLATVRSWLLAPTCLVIFRKNKS